MRYLIKAAALLGIALASFFVGGGVYLLVLGGLWGEKISRGDLTAVLFWHGTAYVTVGLPLCVIFFLVIQLTRRFIFHAGRSMPIWILPLLGALLGWVPTYALVRVWGGGLSMLTRPESLLFFSFFGASGAALGLGWWWLFSRAPRKKV